MNEAFRQFTQSPWGVFQRKGKWYLSQYFGNGIHGNTLEFHDGMAVST
jgi:hypothetical protein